MKIAEQLITENIDLWTSVVKAKSSAGRGGNKKLGLYGIEKLRELIVDLGMRGLLIKQDPNDGSASELLQKIAKEKSQLEQQGILKKHKAFSQVSEKDEPFSLPSNWGWARLGNIAKRIHYGYTAKANPEISNVKLLRITDIQNDKVDWDKVPGCEIREREVSQFKLNPGDILIARTGGTVGKSFWVEDIKISAVFASYLIRIEKCNEVYAPYLKVFLRSSLYWRQLITGARGAAQPNVNGRTLGAMALPLPPLAEQHRIVAKVDELMALCDQLEQEQESNLEAHATLVSVFLNTLTSATADSSQFAEAWQRIQDNFNILFTTESSIDQLKKTVLQLAVMGKLVPQDPEDDTAEELLNRIIKEREMLIKRGDLKMQKKSSKSSIIDNDLFLPKGWTLAPFGDLLFNRDAERVPLSVDTRKIRQGNFDYYGASGVIDSIDNYIFDKPLLLIGEDGANLINRSTPIAFIARGKYWVNNHAHVLDGISEIFLRYVCLHINAISLEPYVTGTAQPKMNQAKMNSIILRIPPEKEQHRIVAKVDEMMALCDKIKERLAAAEVTKLNLADSLVEQAIN